MSAYQGMQLTPLFPKLVLHEIPNLQPITPPLTENTTSASNQHQPASSETKKPQDTPNTRAMPDYVPPEEQVILEKVTAVDPDKSHRTLEPSVQEQLQKSIASTTGDTPADIIKSDNTNLVQAIPEPELVVKRTVNATASRVQ